MLLLKSSSPVTIPNLQCCRLFRHAQLFLLLSLQLIREEIKHVLSVRHHIPTDSTAQFRIERDCGWRLNLHRKHLGIWQLLGTQCVVGLGHSLGNGHCCTSGQSLGVILVLSTIQALANLIILSGLMLAHGDQNLIHHRLLFLEYQFSHVWLGNFLGRAQGLGNTGPSYERIGQLFT